MTLRLAAAVLGLLLAALAARAQDCETLAEHAAAAEGIPPGLLSAVARVESGTRVADGARRAWPWTLNAGGDGSFHGSADEALQRLDEILATGTTNVDLGCMQLNWRWHGGGFPDAATMIDPVENTRYAARFLRRLHDESGSWTAAVALYHSRDPLRGEAYAAKVAAELGNLPATAASPRAGRADAAPATQLRGILVMARAPLVGAAGGDLRSRRLPGFGIDVGRAAGDGG